MSVFINWTESIGIIIGSATEATTGSLFITLFSILIILMAFCMLFGIKLEYITVLILPLMLSYMAYYSDFIAPGIVLLFFIGFLWTKNFIIK